LDTLGYLEGYCSKHDFYGAVNAIHQRQDSDDFQPYSEAKGFLSTLKQHGYHITIASHRSPEFNDTNGEMAKEAWACI